MFGDRWLILCFDLLDCNSHFTRIKTRYELEFNTVCNMNWALAVGLPVEKCENVQWQELNKCVGWEDRQSEKDQQDADGGEQQGVEAQREHGEGDVLAEICEQYEDAGKEMLAEDHEVEERCEHVDEAAQMVDQAATVAEAAKKLRKVREGRRNVAKVCDKV